MLHAERSIDGKPPLLNRRLGDRDDGVAARARPHRYDALHQPIKRREAVIGVLLARALGKQRAECHVLIHEEKRNVKPRIPPVHGVSRLCRPVVEEALSLFDAVGEP